MPATSRGASATAGDPRRMPMCVMGALERMRPGRPQRACRRRPCGMTERRSLRRRDPQGFLDGRNAPLVGVEELVAHLAPAAELVDREQLLRGRELRLVDQRRVDRAIALRGEDLLTLP